LNYTSSIGRREILIGTLSSSEDYCFSAVI
jgi:hypothetical protein